MGDSRRRTLRHNIFVTKPPQGHPASCSPPPRNNTLVSKARSLLLLESLGTPGPATVLVTVDKSQTFLLHLPRVERRDAKLGSRVRKGKGVTVCSHPQRENCLFWYLCPHSLWAEVSQEVRLLEGDSGADICGVHQDTFGNLTRQYLLYYTLRVC